MNRLKSGCFVILAAVVIGMTGCGREKGDFEEREMEKGVSEEVLDSYGTGDDDCIDPLAEYLRRSDFGEDDFERKGAIEFRTEYSVIDKGMKSINCVITNQTDQEVEFGEEYRLEVKGEAVRNGGAIWFEIPFPENMAWNAVAYVLPPGDSCGKIINLSQINFDHFQYSDGEYRIVMEIGDYLVKAEFEMGKSDITPETPFGYRSLETLPEDYSLEMAVENGDVVFSFSESYNLNKLKDFAEKVQLGLPAMVRLVSFTVEGDPIIYDIRRNVVYGGVDYYTLTEDPSRDQWGTGGIEDSQYSYLVTDGKNLYLSNYASFQEDVPQFYRDYRMITGGTSFGYGKAGYGSDCAIPDVARGPEEDGSITTITGFEWIDEESVLLICDTDAEDEICNIIFWPKAAVNQEKAFGER